MKNVLDVLKERGFIKQTVYEDELYELLGKESVPFYIGFDPTADSLHIGHYIPIMAMAWMQRYGHKPIALFGGGTAELKLTDKIDVLNSGIDINVAPPGKVIKNMSLLSGGERAFVAIALYFAILKVRPTPFCMLDEIDAALDDRNVERFASYLKNYSERTQFVVITHRRGTMEAADRIYGVTMHEKGISDVLSIDVSEIEAKTGEKPV